MQWTAFEDPAEYLHYAQPVFLSDEVRYALALGVAVDVARGSRRYDLPARWGMVRSGGEVVGLYQQTLPYPMIWMPLRPDLDATLLEHLRGNGGLPDRMQATRDEVERLAAVRCAQTGETTRAGLHLRCHRLDRVQAPNPKAPGHMRLAGDAENDLLCHWVYRFAVDCGLREQIERGVPEQAPHLLEQGVFLWELDGQPVACAALTRESPHGRTISFVYTPDEQRGRGYASALVAALSQHVLDGGKDFVTLFTDLQNPTSNKIYRALGYQPVEDFLVLEFVTSIDS